MSDEQWQIILALIRYVLNLYTAFDPHDKRNNDIDLLRNAVDWEPK